LAIEDHHMNERALLLGKTNGLVGVLTEPESITAARSRPAIILLNAGLVHRVGPNRIHVQIARRLARSGYLALRFDLAGIGDSGSRTDNLSLRDGVVSDVRDVMDFLAREYSVGRFILAGICSGADHSIQVALQDTRVIAVLPIEPYYFPTAGYYFSFYLRRLFRARSWGRLLSLRSDFWRILKRRIGGNGVPSGPRGGPKQLRNDRRNNFKSLIASEIEQLTDRGVNLHIVYCVHSPSYYNHYLALRSKISARKEFRATVFENTDHTFTLLASQQALLDLVDEWVKDFDSVSAEAVRASGSLAASKSA
jgi:hypothetical protein